MNDQEITVLIGLCSQWWPNWRAPESMPAMVKSWRLLLADVPFDAGQAAISEHATRGEQFPPPLGIVRRRAIELMQPAGSAPTVDEAWRQVQREIHRVGLFPPACPDDRIDRVPTFTHPSIVAVVNAMGWDSLCTSTNEVADRAHFSRMYAERIQRDVDRAAESTLVRSVRAIGEGEAEHLRSLGENIRALVPGVE